MSVVEQGTRVLAVVTVLALVIVAIFFGVYFLAFFGAFVLAAIFALVGFLLVSAAIKTGALTGLGSLLGAVLIIPVLFAFGWVVQNGVSLSTFKLSPMYVPNLSDPQLSVVFNILVIGLIVTFIAVVLFTTGRKRRSLT